MFSPGSFGISVIICLKAIFENILLFSRTQNCGIETRKYSFVSCEINIKSLTF